MLWKGEEIAAPFGKKVEEGPPVKGRVRKGFL